MTATFQNDATEKTILEIRFGCNKSRTYIYCYETRVQPWLLQITNMLTAR